MSKRSNRNRRKMNTVPVSEEKEIQRVVSKALRTNTLKTRVVKYFDTYLNGQNSTTTIGYSNISLMPQGIAQSQRLADTAFVSKLDVRFNATTANADIFATMRWGVFIWWQNTNSVTPGTTSIYESVATYGTLSPFNFEGREYYSILFDHFENFTGTATAPTVNSQINRVFTHKLGNHRIDYEQAATTGTGHLYFVNVSDSAIAPHPVYSIEFRVWYYDS